MGNYKIQKSSLDAAIDVLEKQSIEVIRINDLKEISIILDHETPDETYLKDYLIRYEEYHKDWSNRYKISHSKYSNYTSDMFNSIIESGRSATKSLFLVNSGGAIATLTLMGKIVTSTPVNHINLTTSILFFGLGILSALLVSGFTYLSQACYAGRSKTNQWWGDFIRNAAIVFSIIGMVSFVFGALYLFWDLGGNFDKISSFFK